MTNWRDGSINFEQRGVEFPDFWSVNAANIVTTKYFRGAVGTEVREWSLRQLIDRVVPKYVAAGPRARLLPLGRRRRDLRARAHLDAAAPGVQLQLAGLVQRRHDLAAAGQRVLHPRGRRHDGLDPELVPRGGPDLQGRLRCRAEPVADPLVEGAAVLRRHRVRPGQLHARRRRIGRHDQVRRRDPAGGEDGRARHRPPRHRGVRRDQGARRGQDPRAARRRLRHGSRRRRHHQRAVPERQQLGPGLRRVHAGGRGGRRVRAARPQHARGHRDRRRQGAVRQGRAGRVGVRRPGHPVRRHDQRLAHQPRDRPHHRVQPVLGVHEPRQHVVQPGLAEPDEVPRRRQQLRRPRSSSRRSS